MIATSTAQDLAETFRRLVAALAWLEDQPEEGPQRAAGVRHRLALHITAIADGLAGKAAKCPEHVGHLAHNCGPCRSERIGREPDDPVHVLPPTHADVRDAEARRMGESEDR